jgi:hypothetical protein
MPVTGSIGRFEILPELAILTSDILGPKRSTTLVGSATLRAAPSVTRQEQFAAVRDDQ